MTEITGGCLCGAVRFSAETDAPISLACHCRDCQYVSGGAPAVVVVVPSAALRVTGDTRSFRATADSGTEVHRAFCPDCGTPLFAGNAAHPEVVSIKLGALDDPAAFAPQSHIWTASAQPWHHIDRALPCSERNPQLGG